MGVWLKQELRFEVSVGFLADFFKEKKKENKKELKGRASSEKYQRECILEVCKVQVGDVAPKQNPGLKCSGAVS